MAATEDAEAELWRQCWMMIPGRSDIPPEMPKPPLPPLPAITASRLGRLPWFARIRRWMLLRVTGFGKVGHDGRLGFKLDVV